VEPAAGVPVEEIGEAVANALERLQVRFPGVRAVRLGDALRIEIPEGLREGHEAHFRRVVERFLGYVRAGGLPEWEASNLVAKYRLTTGALAAARPPEGARALFDGSGLDRWEAAGGGPAPWRVRDDVLEIVPGAGSIRTRASFRDFRLHLEFLVPPSPPPDPGEDRGNRGNSGVYLQERYEVQILDSFGFPSETWDCGALYRYRAPDTNAARPAGRWQTCDITFRAPRWEGDGDSARKTTNARITVVHNGVPIHRNVELDRKTGAGRAEGPEPRPILLQDHGSPVRFRNIWIIPGTEE
jgi:hypothetical protein